MLDARCVIGTGRGRRGGIIEVLLDLRKWVGGAGRGWQPENQPGTRPLVFKSLRGAPGCLPRALAGRTIGLRARARRKTDLRGEGRGCAGAAQRRGRTVGAAASACISTRCPSWRSRLGPRRRGIESVSEWLRRPCQGCSALTCSARASCFWRYALVREAPTAVKCPPCASWPTWSRARALATADRPRRRGCVGSAAAAGRDSRARAHACARARRRRAMAAAAESVGFWYAKSINSPRATPIQCDVWYRIGQFRVAHCPILNCNCNGRRRADAAEPAAYTWGIVPPFQVSTKFSFISGNYYRK